MNIGDITASVTETLQLNYVPEVLFFVATTVPTQVKVNVSGDGVTCDLDGAGITEIATVRKIGGVTNGYEIILANGRIDGKTCSITIANAQASTLVIYGRSDAVGDAYMVSEQIAALASQAIDIKDFSTLSMPSLATTDTINIDYRDVLDASGAFAQGGLDGEEVALEELESILANTQNSVNGIVLIDNQNQRIGKVRAIVAIAQTFYKQRIAVIESVNSAQQA